jgi:CRISPR-associated endoribonuclease Cas6
MDRPIMSDLHPPDLYALIIRLSAVHPGRLRATQGHLAHAAFLDMLRQVDAELAQSLHDWNGRKPFTLSPLHGFGQPQGGHITVGIGQEGWLRLTILEPAVFQTFIRYVLHGDGRLTVRLDNLSFQVSEILGTIGSHPLAGATSLAALHQQWETADLQPAHRHITLRFDSPTAFSRKNLAHRHMVVLPDPVLVFGQLATYWDDLTGSETAEAVRHCAAESVVVARHQIATRMYAYRQSKHVGFTGRVTFELLDRDNLELIRHLNRLTDLAFYTGVGSKTTMGMGQVYRMTNEP